MPNNQTNEQMAAYLDDMATRYTEYAASRFLAGAAALRQVDTLAAEGARLRGALGPFGNAEGVGGIVSAGDRSIMRERIVDWFGPSDFAMAFAALANTPATAAWLAAHDAEVRRAALEEAAQMADHRECHAEYHQAAAAYRLLAKQIREWAAQPAKEGRE